MSTIHITEEVDLSKLKHGPKRPRGAGTSCFVSYGSDRELLLQLPRMKVPFGLSRPQEQYRTAGQERYYMEVSLSTDEKYDKKGRISKFKNLMEDIDELTTKYISDQSKKWWKEHSTPKDVKKFNYKSSIVRSKKEDKDGNPLPEDKIFPDRFKIKLPFFDGNS